MASIVEFYIACNPPLLPQGVSEVIRRVQETEGLVEILYEPHVPWFKCIALLNQQQQVTAAVQDNLFAIADEDVDTLDIEEQTDGDVAIISDDPRMTSWLEYKRRGGDAYAFADGDVFPEPIAETKYKTMWRGLEGHPTATFEALLQKCSVLSDGEIPKEHEQFEAQFSCRISYNIRQTVLYVGSDKSRETVEMAVERLNSMLQLYNNNWRGALPRLLPPAEVIPATQVSKPCSHDPFDDIPSDVNSTLQETMTPCSDPFNNLKSLL